MCLLLLVSSLAFSQQVNIDDATTYVDFNKPLKEQRTKVNILGEIDKNEGIFFFPVWQSNSLVKRQNVTAKIPSAMQLAVMYGSNVDALKEFGFFKGLLKSIKRILSCHPIKFLGGGEGFDPVKKEIKDNK